MKKLLFITLILCTSLVANAQEFFGSATNKSGDGYLTAGYVKKGWGIYTGFLYNEDPMVNTKTGSFGASMKLGVIRMFSGERLMLGVGIQPQNGVNKPNAWIGYAPLKSEGLKIWVIGNLVGNSFTPGLGLTYKLEKIVF